jgi:hypothetical protein
MNSDTDKPKKSKTTQSEEINYDRRGFLRTAAVTIVAAELGMIGFADAQSNKAKKEDTMTQTSDKNAIRPFHVNVPEVELAELVTSH